MTPEELRAEVQHKTRNWQQIILMDPVLLTKLVDLWEAGQNFYYGWAHSEGQEDGVAALASTFSMYLDELEEIR